MQVSVWSKGFFEIRNQPPNIPISKMLVSTMVNEATNYLCGMELFLGKKIKFFALSKDELTH